MNKKLNEAKRRLFKQMISADHVELNEHVDDFMREVVSIFIQELSENKLKDNEYAEAIDEYVQDIAEEFLKNI